MQTHQNLSGNIVYQ